MHIFLARYLRKRMTPEERILWNILRNRQFNGFKFLRQHPLHVSMFKEQPAFYIADFYCAAKKLVVEVDGPIHKQRKNYDDERDSSMYDRNISVLRFTNDEINYQLESVLEKIAQCLN